MATVAIGSIRGQIYGTAPPRGLFCDFPLGRPLGVPGDAAFQRRVLERAFAMLERTEPAVEDYEVVIEDGETQPLACPLPPRMDPDAHPAIDEAKGLRPAYDRAIAKYGNRAGAVRLLDADSIPAAIESFIRVAEGHPWKQAGIPGIPARVSQDIRGYYEMAAMEIADHTPAAWAGYRWFRDETKTGEVIRQARDAMRESGAKEPLWRFLMPSDS
ncbi:MAG: hypothetical protein OXH15_17725 [Gammaproteobacteria bacterium]|nr:hypothetical protein [Gammaproteobacteria bacterium]